MTRLLVCLMFGMAISPIFANYSKPVEIRAVWMDKGSIPKTEQGIREMIRGYAKAGINMVHPEVIYNGYSAYPSSYLTQKDLWEGVDMLGILTDECHKQEIEVHPWVWIFRTGNINDKGGILTRHPEWAALNREGEALTDNNSYWLCPSHPGVRQTLLRAIAELCEKFPVDGVQLDYVRFPTQTTDTHCFNETCRTKFQIAHGIDPLDIEPFTPPIALWHQWREDLVSSFVRESAEMIRNIRPNLQVSAAVASYPEKARMDMLQNWEHWAENKWVDFLSPMDYSARAEDFARRVNSSSEIIANRALLAPGIGIYLQQGTEPMLEQVEIARNQPTEGVTIFATHYFGADRLAALQEGPFNRPAILPTRSPIEAARVLTESARSALGPESTTDDLDRVATELKSAMNLIQYAQHQLKPYEYTPPTPAPIFIPEKLVPIPEVIVPRTSAAPTIDGALDDPAWKNAAKLTLDYDTQGYDPAEPTDVYLTHDGENIYFAFRAYESMMDRIRAEVTDRDGPVFYEDSVEFFIGVSDKPFEYFQFAVNSLGTQFDADSRNASYNASWTASTGRESNAWTVEVAIPIAELKASALGEWRMNICRNRAVKDYGPDAERMCWSPTYGSYHTPQRFGTLSLE